MADLATPIDVGRRLQRDITDGAVYENVMDLLAAASAVVRSRVPTVDARIAALTLNADLVRYIVAEMVSRVLRNPDGLRQESIEDYSYVRDAAAAAGSLVLTADDEALLRGEPASATAAPLVGTVNMGVGMPYPCRSDDWSRRRGW